MEIVKQKSRHPWIIFDFFFAFIAFIGSIILGYYHWPPQFSFNWVIGSIVTTGFFMGALNFGLCLLYNGPCSFEVEGSNIIIRDWGGIRPRVRSFPAASVDKIFHYTGESDGSGLITSDGKSHYIDQILMRKYTEIFRLIECHFNHIQLVTNNKKPEPRP